jgi:hypothetical protein
MRLWIVDCGLWIVDCVIIALSPSPPLPCTITIELILDRD